MYITATDIEAVVPPGDFLALTDRDQDGDADDAVLAAAIDAAAAELHGYLARRYQLPLNDSDAVLLAFIKPGLVDLATRQLHPRADMVTDKLQSRIDTFIQRLEAIRDGKADLPSSSPPPPAGAGSSGIRWSAKDRKIGEMP